ncbi:hypothetical protein BVZ28_19905 [Alcaligenes faecalis]|uniref:Uncharacterized protein n=1 Tax=Alcaligenes faecalis TaxID=511 RepID=A0A2U2BF56_ALCFA|nr:hypothetical protein UZ73_19125 [Alcaligenes faecalis]ATI01379.1 hypothetical protein CPY64_17360 [Alcaligenes faecalis]AYZ90734.1 hypothetical protein EGY22_04235 [Alcaligenes faecalis]KAA1284664.1 hypothetical protein D7S43_16835 [Alcaligenes faecalis]OSZ29001.1 hypothetical protein BVZ28_19905 [Alcaligenes faecalis]
MNTPSNDVGKASQHQPNAAHLDEFYNEFFHGRRLRWMGHSAPIKHLDDKSAQLLQRSLTAVIL